MSLKAIDPRKRPKHTPSPKPKEVNKEPIQVKPAEIVALERLEAEPVVVHRRKKEKAEDYSMFRFWLSLGPGQRKAPRVAEKFGAGLWYVRDVQNKHEWTIRGEAYDTWIMLREQHDLTQKQIDHRQSEEILAKALLSRAIERMVFIPDTQILGMIKEYSKMGRLALGMPTAHQEVHHRHTMEVVIRKMNDIATRHISANAIDAYRRDLNQELPSIVEQVGEEAKA